MNLCEKLRTCIRLVLAPACVFVLDACSDGRDVAGGTSEDAGIVALAGKKLSGAVQKGPFVEGSSVVLRETSAEGSLEPTGKEFNTTVTNDKGDFEFDSLDLESPYALLSAEGHYIHDVSGERSVCVLHLNAITNMEKRITANINLLTHFEYKRVLKLVKDGVPFAQAKKQAAAEVLAAFGVFIPVNSAEDLNIFSTSAADMALYHISIFVDTRDFIIPWNGEGNEWEYRMDPANTDCGMLQDYVDGYADDLEEDGTLSDSLIAPLAYTAYLYNSLGNVMHSGETGLIGRDEYDLMAERRYFHHLVLDHYLGFEECNDKRWGESRILDKPFGYYNYDLDRMEYVNPAYFLCDGMGWKYTTKGHLDSLKMPIPHGSGTMKDPRDGREYKTVSFEFLGTKYEWMAEDLMYSDASTKTSKGRNGGRSEPGIYSWAAAMGLSESYMTKAVKAGMVDSLHQGICPSGWHVANSLDWEALVTYVGGVNNLLNESWRTDSETASDKDLVGVFYNRFDFNLYPMEKKYLDLYYHTYTHESFIPENVYAERSMWLNYYEAHHGSEDIEWIPEYANALANYRDLETYAFEISIDYGMPTENRRKAGRVRCVKN
ncbi:major paralogous domain-containing protein [Fibrobacter sp. UWT3]|uniref:FISUMP domain-containing protein n=1 Tax=Fibrobacter sp. UWT3 TaxID=1896225 RepID=UPI000BC4733D|nr:FISUMP domain-containing protein [Fibrobacter sp. UWT3]SOE45720.1 major paralogous domain-containing protein [Fibrobacter sp. UWT3]